MCSVTKTASFTHYASVIVDRAVDRAFDYGIPPHLVGKIREGMVVEVSFRGKIIQGYVLSLKEQVHRPVLPLQRPVFDQPLATLPMLKLADWMSEYYCTPLYKVLQMMLPAMIREERTEKKQWFVFRKKTKKQLQEQCRHLRTAFPAQAKLLEIMLKVKSGIFLTELLERAAASRSPLDTLVKKQLLELKKVSGAAEISWQESYFQTEKKTLTAEQKQAWQQIVNDLDRREFAVHLLFGVTGSGKTEVYLQAVDRVLQRGGSALILLPEVALTAQMIERFRSRFSEPIALLHYRCTPKERWEMWHRIRRGEIRIVVGARCAVFSPLENLELIIVDEEHESSYKQEQAPCYHARHVAIMRGKIENAVVVLGSATPSLESRHNCDRKKYQLSTLSARPQAASLPSCHIVDMSKEAVKEGYRMPPLLSSLLLQKIRERQQRGEQVMLFLNRRGYHTTLLCQSCFTVMHCPHCAIALTFHLQQNCCACHICGYRRVYPFPCLSCKSGKTVQFKGMGTEFVQKLLQSLFPSLKILRMDADTTRHKGSNEQIFREFRTGKGDVLVGTQMIAKGLHFPAVTLVGVLQADASLHRPDFMAAEQTFQLITQVGGRAGRGELPGELVIQTWCPDNAVIRFAAKQDYPRFYEEELAQRELFSYPPFQQMIKVVFSSVDEKGVFAWASRFHSMVKSQLPAPFHLHPLLPSGYPKIKDRYYFQFLLRGQSVYQMNALLASIQKELRSPRSVRILIDVHPLSTFF